MPRPIKDPDQRQRRNKAPTAATLPSPDSPDLAKTKAPPLNADMLGIKGAVKPQVRRWWGEVWHSPMAGRWLKTDVEVLYVCALIRHQMAEFAAAGKSVATLAGELRQQESRVGLDVLARRRLDWRIEGPRPPTQEPATEAPTPAEDAPADFDPRQVLRAVK